MRQVFLNAFPHHQAQQLIGLSNYEVITPSRQAARALDAPMQSLWEYAVKQLKKHSISVAPALASQKLFRQTVQTVLKPNDLVGTARTLLPTVRTLLQSSSNLENIPPEVSPRTQQILQLAQQYQFLLHQFGLVDSNEIYWRTAEKSLEPTQLLLYGYFQLRPDELELIDKIAGDESVLFLPTLENDEFQQNRSALDFLQSRGWQVVADQSMPVTPGEQLFQSFLTPANTPDGCVVYAYGSLESEVRGTLAQVKQLLDRQIPAKDIVIIAQNEVAYGPVLLDVAWEYGIPCRALYDTPISSTRLGAWLALLLDTINRKFPFEATAKLLSHPLCTNPDAEFWSVMREQKPNSLADWTKFAQEQISINLTVLKQSPRLRRDNWVSWIQAIFKAFDLRQRCARWPRESVAFSNLDSSLREFSRPEAEILTWAEFSQEFLDSLDLLTVPAQPGRGGVELHSPQALVGSQYPYVFVLGMAEGIFPPTVQNDPVLDFYERKQLAQAGFLLENAAAAARRESLGFLHLLQSISQQVVFSYAKLNGRQEQVISPYLERLKITASLIPELPIASLEEMRQRYLTNPDSPTNVVLVNANHAWQVEQSRESAAAQDQYDGVVGVPFDYQQHCFSVSQLNDLGCCPFKWFANKVLKLGELDEDEIDLSPGLRGNLYHATVELMVKAVQDDPARSITDLVLLREKFLEAEQKVKLPILPAWASRREEHLRTLALTLQQPDFWPMGAEPVALEGSFTGEWHGLKITGRVDRIDRTGEGLVLIDYKTGSKAPKGVSDESGVARLDIQLPIYQQVAAAALFPDESVAGAYYYSLGKGKKLPVPKTSIASDEELSMFADRCKSHLTNGHFPVMPDNKKVACEYCSFDVVCRQGSRLSRKGGTDGIN
jgi:ATP-dependent helicase/DNAse subunit B